MGRLTARACFSILLCTLFASLVPHQGSAEDRISTVDRALIAIETADRLPIDLPAVISDAGHVVSSRHGVDAHQPTAIMMEAAKKAFDADAWHNKLLASLKAGEAMSAEDSEAFLAASQKLIGGYEAVSKLIRDKNVEGQKQLLDKADGASKADIETLITLMAFPEISVESAKTSELLQNAIGVVFDGDLDQIIALSPADVTSLAKSYVDKARDVDPRSNEILTRVLSLKKLMLSMALANLSAPDLQTLKAFYASEQGKQKKMTLLATYRSELEVNTRAMLEQYFSDVGTFYSSQKQ